MRLQKLLKAAGKACLALAVAALSFGTVPALAATPDPGGIPHYFGPFPNYANSPLPKGGVGTIEVQDGGIGYSATPTVTITDLYEVGSGATATATVVGGVITGFTITNPGSNYFAPVVTITDATGVNAAAQAYIGGPFTGGIRKFVDNVAGLNFAGRNNLGQYIPVAIPDTTSFPGADYYVIELGQYTEKLHTDLPPTTLRGYRQVNTADNTVNQFRYLGPLIVAQRDRPVRIKFVNSLPTGPDGNLFIPVDTSYMGAGMGPVDLMGQPGMKEYYTQNRATLHLHGGFVPWISDGTPHQWTTPAGETTSYPKGVSVQNVPDMPDPGDGSLTFYYNNQQSARLMFYHDHAYGITRLNVYAGEAAGYLITDQVEQDLINGTNVSGVNPGLVRVLPDVGIPLIVQDKTFVDNATIAYQDPTWNWGTGPRDPVTGKITRSNTGDLWASSVYMPAQNPWASDLSGTSAFGRWMYGPWFWPPTPLVFPPVANEYYDPLCDPTVGFCEPPMRPDMPTPAGGMEAFNDTMLVNGTIYPVLHVEPKTYRFRVLNAANDRFVNLQLYVADNAVVTADGRTDTEVKMVPAIATPGFPATWSNDAREGGVPDPALRGPSWVQIGTEGGFLPKPVVLPPQPINWNMNATAFNVGNVTDHSLLLGCAERADVLVDFTNYAGKTLILYNDSPAAFPALNPQYDYYTNNPNRTDIGSTPRTQPGYGPNVRTVMQIKVAGSAASPFPLDLGALDNVFAKTAGKRGVFEVSQDNIIVPQAAYNSAYDLRLPADAARAYVQIFEFSKTFTPLGSSTPVTIPFETKAIHDEMGGSWDKFYGRMSGMLGLELPNSNPLTQNMIFYPYSSPPVDITTDTTATQIGQAGDGTQIWKITHNGVDTHPMHWHLFNLQLINRVAWDGMLLPPDANELGWKETIRVNPLEDTIVAMRPRAPISPFDVPNSIRLIDPTRPEGDPLDEPPLGEWQDPAAQPVGPILNHYVNFGWEYVWHCHILSHEEMDMMHALSFGVAPAPPSALTAAILTAPLRTSLTWTDGSRNETAFVIQRATDNAFTAGLTSITVSGSPNGAVGGTMAFSDNTIAPAVQYYYRVLAANKVGDNVVYPAPSIGFPTKTLNSSPSNTAATGIVIPVTLASSPADNAAQGAQILFTASATGAGPYEYEFQARTQGATAWITARGYAQLATFTWNSAGAPFAVYEWRVNVRRAGSAAASEGTSAVLAITLIDPQAATAATLGAAPPATAPMGTQVVFTAGASGGTGPYEFMFQGRAAGSTTWSTARGYAAGTTFTWNTAGAPFGNYEWQVLARRQGSVAPFEATSPTVTYAITDNLAATAATLGAAPPATAPMGTQVVFTAGASGGTGPYEFMFQGRAAGSTTWSTARGYAAGTTFTWNTAGAPFGNYEWQVLARRQGSVAPFEATSPTVTYAITDNLAATAATLLPATATVAPGTPVAFTAGASGGPGPYEFEFQGRAVGATTWLVARGYNASTAFSWDTTAVPAGGYEWRVNARRQGSVSPAEATSATSTITVQ